MIVTLTANPSLDRTVDLAGAVARGDGSARGRRPDEPGGKGVNVARALTSAGAPLSPSCPPARRPAARRAAGPGRAYRAVARTAPVRANITVTEPGRHDHQAQRSRVATRPRPLATQLVEVVLEEAGRCPLGGAVRVRCHRACPPTGTPRSSRRCATQGCLVAVDTSGEPLRAVAPAPLARPDLVKPNAEELAELTGARRGTARGRPRVRPRRPPASLVARGVGAVLATLGAARCGARRRRRRRRAAPRASSRQHCRRRRLRARRLPARRSGRCAARAAAAEPSPTARRGQLPGSAMPHPTTSSLRAVTSSP